MFEHAGSILVQHLQQACPQLLLQKLLSGKYMEHLPQLMRFLCMLYRIQLHRLLPCTWLKGCMVSHSLQQHLLRR